MLDHLPAALIVPKRWAGLKPPRLLQQRLLRMQLDRPAALSPNALRP